MKSEETEPLEQIAIVGMAGRFPGADTIDRFWRNLCDGRESITAFSDAQLLATGEDPDLLKSPRYVKSGVVLEGVDLFDADFFGFTPREAEVTDPQHRIFLECAWEALENAGYDPEQYSGRVGVFAGAGVHCFYQHGVLSSPHLIGRLSELQRLIAVEKDFLATRVSYKLNLRGPSITIQTACSTSLVAVHMGCQSLLNGESDMVLAGGVAIRLPQNAGYLTQEGSILSPDGHCRAFDALAKGTVFGSGAGIVVLKRLSDAQADGDCIQAVIRASCINNDGAVKVGYTAPSVDGQAAVVAEAQALAGVTGDEISYIEAHGTGTELGDPIEVAALTKAFRRTTPKKTFCAIGSLKTNIGHLDTASGVAGLIKVVLALRHRMLPPSLNFQEPNPNIDFAGSPFYVQQALSAWQPANGKRVAGVSSFGIGGTNAHLVVEEGASGEGPDPSRPWQLLPISARSNAALDSATERLAACLRTNRDLDLADVAFTLQRGRKAFAYRRILAAQSVEDAIDLLETRNPKRVHNARAPEDNTPVVFMFPGQAAQYADMGRGLYETERVFRDSIDRCAEYLQPGLKLDLRTLLFPNGGDAERASAQLGQTQFTQPAVFMVEYALAQLWMSWGIMPAAMVGHSLGDYVAATLSGVFSLEDALALVAERGRLMQELPTGSMLAVNLPEEALGQWLRDGVSLAAVNAPGLSVVSGPRSAIEQLAETFRSQHVEVQPLRTSHAFHSAMMEPMVAPFIERVGQVARHAPAIPFVSSLTGTWITADQAVDPAYWGKQARYGVRFSAAMRELLTKPERVFLEVGPGKTLCTLARLHLRGEARSTVAPSLRHAQDTRPDHDCMLTALGCLWAAGVPVDWSRLYTHERRQRVALPTYPFERRRFWVDTRPWTPGRPVDAGRDSESAPERPADAAVAGDAASMGTSLYSRPGLASEYVAPRTEVEQSLSKLWSEALGVKDIGIHDDFFDLGGQSLLAVTLLSEVERTFGKRLPLAALIQGPTIHQFSKLIGEEQPASSWSSLVTLNSAGSERPLFLMHSHGGNVLEYQPLVHRLGKERPIYALQARGLDGRIPEEPRIEEMASYYLQELRAIQPQGPYYLGGFCFGGLLALEAAQQLRMQNEEVALLVMINAATTDYPAYPPRTTRAHRLLYGVAYRLALEWEGMSLKPWRSMPAHLAGRARRMKDVLRARAEMLLENLPVTRPSPERSRSMTYHLERLAMAHDRAWSAYRPEPYDGKVLYLSARRQPLGIRPDPMLGWKGLLTGECRFQEVPGFRQSMLDEPHVATLASVVRGALQECDTVNVAPSYTSAAVL